MDFQELKNKTGLTTKGISDFFNIPIRTVTGWANGSRSAQDYVVSLMNYKWEHKDCNVVVEDVTNFHELKEKMNLPLTKISEFFGIPYINVQRWNSAGVVASDYVVSLMNYKWDCENKK